MEYGFMGWFIKYAFSKTVFGYISKERFAEIGFRKSQNAK